jgi:hypothetical protein
MTTCVMRRTHYFRNSISGLFVLLLLVAGFEMFARSLVQSCGVKVQSVSCTSTDAATCQYSFSLDVTNNTGFTGQATLSGAGLQTYISPTFQAGSGNIVTGTLSVPCGTTGVSLTLSLPGTNCTVVVQVPLPKCFCNVQATATNQTICKGASTQVSLPTTTGSITWYSSSPCASPIPPSGVVPPGWSPVTGGTTSSITVAPAQTTCYQAVIANLASCPTGTGVSNPVAVTVVSPSSPGSIGCTVGFTGIPCPANNELCSGSVVNLTDPNTPGPNCSRQWYQWNGSVWQLISGATGATLTQTLSSSTCPFVPAKFRVVYSCPPCPGTFSEISFKVYSPVQGGTITASPICDGDGDVLTLANSCGDVVQWESSSSGLAGTFNVIQGSGGTFTWYTNKIPPHDAWYQVLVKNGPCGAVYSNKFHVTINHKPNPTITAGGPLQFCAPGSVMLTATNPNGGTCQWYRNGLPIGSGMTWPATASGNYYMVCSNSCGITKSNIITVKASKPLAVITGACGVCPPNCVSLSALVGGGVPPYTFAWSQGGSGQSINACPTTTQTYTLTVTDAIGCTTTANHTIEICPQQLIADAGKNITTCPGGSVTIGGAPTASGGTGTYTYLWSPAAGLSNPTIANPTATPSQTTTYTLTVTDATTGCIATSTVIVTVKGPPCAVRK